MSSQEKSVLLFRKRRRRRRKTLHARTRSLGERKTRISLTCPSFSFYLPMWKEKTTSTLLKICSRSSIWQSLIALSLSLFFSLSEFTRCDGEASKGKCRAVSICLSRLDEIKVQPYLTWNPADMLPFQPSVVFEGKKTNTNERIFFL